jgi:hypothetical protein
MPVQSKETPNENYFVALTIALTLPGVSQAAEPKLEITTLTENIYMLSGKGGGNIGVLTGPARTFFIGNQLEKTVPVLLKTIETLGGTISPRFV